MLFENITALCKDRGITISRLEKEVGLGNATIRGWAQSSPKIDKLKKVADYFEVTLDDLLRGYAEGVVAARETKDEKNKAEKAG